MRHSAAGPFLDAVGPFDSMVSGLDAHLPGPRATAGRANDAGPQNTAGRLLDTTTAQGRGRTEWTFLLWAYRSKWRRISEA